jgi:hypothetical protein
MVLAYSHTPYLPQLPSEWLFAFELVDAPAFDVAAFLFCFLVLREVTTLLLLLEGCHF